MAALRYTGIAAELADAVRRTQRSPQYGHPAHRERAQGYGPCRLCLHTFAVGEEERILFTYQPFSEPGSLRRSRPTYSLSAASNMHTSATARRGVSWRASIATALRSRRLADGACQLRDWSSEPFIAAARPVWPLRTSFQATS
jgi:hypothetical protein